MRRTRAWFFDFNYFDRVAWAAGLALSAAGCGGGRVVSISTTPADAMLKIDDVETARAPAAEKFQFANGEPHKVLASRFGYSDQERVLSEDSKTGNLIAAYTDPTGREVRETVGDELRIVLRPKRKQITFKVTPVPAVVTLDGVPLSTGPVGQVARWVEFYIDADNHWVPHTVTVTRPGFPDVSRSVQWTDPDPVYTIQLEPYRKDLHILSRPPGAEIFVDGESRNAAPVSLRNVAFPVDPATGQFVPRKITAKKPGFDPVDLVIGWDNGQTDYTIDLATKIKRVRITTDPPGGIVKLDGAELPRDVSGLSTGTFAFPPADDAGTPRVYIGWAYKKEGDREWEAAPFQIAWDNGRPTYLVRMDEVKTRSVALVRPKFVRDDAGWRLTAETLHTVAPKDIAEPAGVNATPLLRLPAAKGGNGPNGGAVAGVVTNIDTLATSPDGAQIVFSVVSLGAGGEFHSQLMILDVDGGPGGATPHAPRPLGDDKSLSLFPSFSPDGKRVLFSSNRESKEGKRMSIWWAPADGSAAPARLTAGDTNDLWPSLDSLPQPRLFYESLLVGRPDPRLFFTRIGPAQGTAGTDLAQVGSQPHVSPTADAVLFAAPVPGAPAAGVAAAAGTPADAGRRHLFTIPDAGGRAVELNHTANFDDFDPAWSKDGSRIAFASNRPRKATGEKAEKAGAAPGVAGDYNIWVIDSAHPDSATPLTFNGAWDDCPAWDSAGKAVYFRSNRGGEWGIWKVSWK